MITYIDRVVISSAVPSIQKEFGFSIVTMGWILSSFQWAYALFQIPGGWLGDRIGPSPRDDIDRELVVSVYLLHGVCLERGIDGVDSFPVWDG